VSPEPGSRVWNLSLHRLDVYRMPSVHRRWRARFWPISRTTTSCSCQCPTASLAGSKHSLGKRSPNALRHQLELFFRKTFHGALPYGPGCSGLRLRSARTRPDCFAPCAAALIVTASFLLRASPFATSHNSRSAAPDSPLARRCVIHPRKAHNSHRVEAAIKQWFCRLSFVGPPRTERRRWF
jgi:hypothetical protein